tara:strand:- start:669 stop:935 length:267 start_codon:yes stop_codon:yes gene_type:complete
MATKKNKKSTPVEQTPPVEEEMVTHSRKDFDAIIAQSFNNGAQDGMQKMKDHIVSIVQTHATNLFLGKQDELAKELRKVLTHLQGINV